MINHASLFSGIGGFDLAAEWMGWNNVLQCEIDEFCQKVLEYHFPNADLYGDIRELNGKQYRGQIDVLTGGFPCQPFSAAGKRRGTEDERYLWGEMLEVIQQIQPTWVIAENVRGIVTIDKGMVFEGVCTDLEANGYEVQPFCIPACAIGAPHRRDRIWFVAYSHSSELNRKKRRSTGEKGGEEKADGQKHDTTRELRRADELLSKNRQPNKYDTDTNRKRWERSRKENKGRFRQRDRDGREKGGCWRENWVQAAARLCSMDDGLPRELDGITVPKWRRESLKSYGNSIVPQVAYQIFKSLPITT